MENILEKPFDCRACPENGKSIKNAKDDFIYAMVLKYANNPSDAELVYARWQDSDNIAMFALGEKSEEFLRESINIYLDAIKLGRNGSGFHNHISNTSSNLRDGVNPKLIRKVMKLFNENSWHHEQNRYYYFLLKKSKWAGYSVIPESFMEMLIVPWITASEGEKYMDRYKRLSKEESKKNLVKEIISLYLES